MSRVDLDALASSVAGLWCAPWSAHTFEIDCPCPNGVHCGNTHSCDEIEAPKEYPDGQCVVQISLPGLETFSGPNAAGIVAMRNAIDPLIAELRAARKVVEAVRPVHCRPDSVGGYTYDDRPIRAAIEEYDAVVKL